MSNSNNNIADLLSVVKKKAEVGGVPPVGSKPALPPFVELLMQYNHLKHSLEAISKATADPIMQVSKSVVVMQKPSENIVAPGGPTQAVSLFVPADAFVMVCRNILEVLDKFDAFEDDAIKQFVVSVSAFRKATEAHREELVNTIQAISLDYSTEIDNKNEVDDESRES